MVSLRAVFSHIKRSGKYSIYIVAGVLLVVWGLETPAGIMGKADAIGYAVCHRIDLRSFHIGLRQMPLCARCTGQYVGAMIGLLFQAVFARRRSGFPSRAVLSILGIFGLAYVVDGLNSFLSLPPFLQSLPWLPHLYTPTNLLRLLTGTGVGLAIAVLLYPAFIGSLYTQPDNRPAIHGIIPLFELIVTCLVADALILTGSSYILYPAALVSTCGVVILLTLAYTTVILRIFKVENTYTRLLHISLPLVAGFVVAMSQIALFDLLRYILTGTWGGLILG
jgi:uncharacterized membrane protein